MTNEIKKKKKNKKNKRKTDATEVQQERVVKSSTPRKQNESEQKDPVDT